MRAYWEIAKAGFRRHARYRTALVAATFTNTVFGLIRASLLLTALAAHGGPIGGYDAAQAATYVWLSQALLGPLDVWGGAVDIGERVKSGEIAVDFLRPVSVLGASVAANFGRAAFELLPRGLPPIIIGSCFTTLHAPHRPEAWLAASLSLVLATVLCHCYYVMVHALALWTVENRGFVMLATTVQQLLCGFLVPISWFPGWLRAIAIAGPFPSMFQTVTDMVTETATGNRALLALATQAGWTAALVAGALLLLHLGRRRVVIQGG